MLAIVVVYRHSVCGTRKSLCEVVSSNAIVRHRIGSRRIASLPSALWVFAMYACFAIQECVEYK